MGQAARQAALGAAVLRAHALVLATRAALTDAQRRRAALPWHRENTLARQRAGEECRRASVALTLARAEEAAAIEAYTAAGGSATR